MVVPLRLWHAFVMASLDHSCRDAYVAADHLAVLRMHGMRQLSVDFASYTWASVGQVWLLLLKVLLVYKLQLSVPVFEVYGVAKDSVYLDCVV